MAPTGPSHIHSHWCMTLHIAEAGPPGTTSAEKKSFHCVLRLITCLGSGGLNGVTAGAASCWRGHGKCERVSPSVLLKDFTQSCISLCIIGVIYTWIISLMRSVDLGEVIRDTYTRGRIMKTNIWSTCCGRGFSVLLTHMDAWLICTPGLDLA